MLTPTQVARKANVSSQSIRNYSADYADLLSSTASRSDGPRLYTDEDASILCVIADLRKSGMPRAEIIDRIQNGDAPPIVEAVANAPSNEAQEAQKTGQDATLAVQTVLSTLNARFEAIERRFEARDRQAMWWTLGMGIWLGIVFSGLVLVVVWLLVNA